MRGFDCFPRARRRTSWPGEFSELLSSQVRKRDAVAQPLARRHLDLRRSFVGKVGRATRCGNFVYERALYGLDEMSLLLGRGLMKPLVDEVMDLARVGEAHERLESGHGRGKVVLRVSEG